MVHTDQDITRAERDLAKGYLQQTRDGVVQAVGGFTEPQWDFRRAEDEWSSAEIVEHLAMVEAYFCGTVAERLRVAQATGLEETPQLPAERVVDIATDLSERWVAPQVIRPTGAWKGGVAIQHFVERCGGLAEFLETSDMLHGRTSRHPRMGEMDGYRWILFIAAHRERHRRHIEQIKADPRFPSTAQATN